MTEIPYPKFLRSIVLSGGGTRCISYMGGLLLLRKKGFLAGVTRWYCCSAGAIIGVLFSLGISDEAAKKFVMEFDFEKSRDINAEGILSITETFGLDKGIALKKLISLMLESVHPKSNRWTIRDLKEATGNDMHFFISNVSKSKPFFASASSHPDLFIMDAIYATMAIPFYFQPYKYEGDFWCDGMLGQNFPWSYIPEEYKATALGLYFPRKARVADISLFDYLDAIISFRNNFETDKVLAEWSSHCIQIPTSEFPAILLTLSKEDRKYLYKTGLSCVKKWIDEHSQKFRSNLKLKNHSCPKMFSGRYTLSVNHSVTEEPLSDSLKSSQTPYKDSHLPQGLLKPSALCYRRWSL